MGFKDSRFIYMAVLASITVFISIADGLDPPDVTQFEAAFQGRCGRASPCTQLCRELHDGTYECGCRPGHVLHKDGYSCQELNTTSKSMFDNYIDTEEDVLYQKDASFSAELDIAMVPAKDSENITMEDVVLSSTSQVIATMPSFIYYQTQNILDESIDNETYSVVSSSRELDSNTIPYYHESIAKNTPKHGVQGTPLYNRYNNKKFENSSVLNGSKQSYDDVLLLPTIEPSPSIEVSTKKSSEEVATSKEPVKEDDERTLIVTTLGPSLEQKVPPMSTVDPGHTESAIRIGCPLGKSGENCERSSPVPTVPHFSDGSWLSLPALRGAYKRVHLHMEFRPTSSDGLLLLTGERADMTGDYLVLLLRRGYVELIFDCGSGPGVVKSDTTIFLNQWNSLTLYRRRWDAWIQLNGGRHVQGRSKGLFSRMTFLDPVYVGGRGNMSGLEKLPVQTGYKGCVRSLNINGRSYSWALKSHGDALGGFNINECLAGGCGRGCLHGGRCLKRCLCPLGYSGEYCQNVLDLQVPRFNGSSFLRYPGMKDTALSWLELQITLKPTDKNGLIMYNAHRNDGIGDFFAIYLKDNHAEFAFDLGTGQATIRNAKELKLDNWYTISVSRTGRLAVLTVVSYGLTTDPDESPGLETSQGLTPGAFTQLSLSQNLYLGGAPQFDLIEKRINISESFNGCIQKVVINDHEQNIVSSALGGVNIDGCSHACSSEPCGASTCRPHLYHYTCICSPGDENEKCTVYLNETDVHYKYPSRSHYLGETERMEFLHYIGENTSKHSNIVAKKGPKLVKYYHSYVMPKKGNSREENKSKTKKSAQKDFNAKNKDIGEQEWILSKNYERELNSNPENYEIYIDQESINSNKHGKEVTAENYKNVLFNSMAETNFESDIPSFQGQNSFIKNNDLDVLERLSSHSVDVNIRFKSIKSDGLLLWLGKDGMVPGDTFMALAIENGYLTFRYDLGSGEVIIVANQTKVDNGVWHRARAARKGQSGVLDIDGLGAVGKVSPGRIRPLNTDSGLYIGGMPSIWPETLGRYNSGLDGCISTLMLDREYQIPINLKPHKYTISRNVGKCPP